jgi:hypothetical protein
MSAVINSFYTNEGAPALGLTPTIRIWEVDGASETLIVGSPINTDGVMLEVGDGFYKFEFTTAMAYDQTKSYLFRTDGGMTLSNSDRYQSEAFDPTQELSNIPDAVWSETAIDHISSGSMGELINITHATTQSLVLSVNDIITLVDLLLKYETNRTRIDAVAKTLTVFDDDGTTELRVFRLIDGTGTPSVEEVCERNPISATDGQPVNP